jgi:hypothetical protein
LSRVSAAEFSVPEDGSWPCRLSLVAGLSYAAVGLLQILVSVGLVAPIMGFTDVVGGFLLIIVAAVFLTGVRPLSKNEQEGYAFIAVGYILAAVLFGLQILVILTNGIGWLLRFQNWLNWDISNDISPSLWMFMVLMIGTGSVWVIGNLREKLVPRSKEGLPS